MKASILVGRLKDIRQRWQGKGDFDYNTMFKVKRDAEEAIRLVESYNGNPNAISEFRKAIKLSESEDKEDDDTKRDAIGALEYGIQLFFDEG